MSVTGLDFCRYGPPDTGDKGVSGFYTGGIWLMICENCGRRPASVQVFQQQGDRRVTNYLCTQCARQLGMIGGAQGGTDPFEMLQNLIQQQQGAQGSLFDALSGEAQQAVMRAREASAGTTGTAAIGTDHLLAGIVTGDNVATEALQRAGADVNGMRTRFQESGATLEGRSQRSPRAPNGLCSSPSPPQGRWAPGR
jgi:hypothetical protein